VVKQKVKQAVSFISDFEEQLAEVAKANRCQGVICGHIHQPANKMIGDIHYLNSGDWVETLSALVEDENGKWEIIYYAQWAVETQAVTPDSDPLPDPDSAKWLLQPA
jgi:UDP-2,3-diacylglucosamine pyrophosphatase LpxH